MAARINNNGIRYTKEDLILIGNNVAALWGASCIDFKVSHQTRTVEFYCIEHGEFFATNIGFDELEEYHY